MINLSIEFDPATFKNAEEHCSFELALLAQLEDELTALAAPHKPHLNSDLIDQPWTS